MTGAGYYLNSRNFYADARAAIPTLSKNFRIANIDLRGSSGGTGSLYYDAVAFDGGSSLAFDDAHPVWTSNSQNGLSTDRVASSYSLKITSAALSASPDCAGCTNSDLTQFSFLKWWWKKVGGLSIAFVVHLKDARNPAMVGDITYYAGPAPPDAAVNPVQVSPVVPTDWAPVTRNVLEDARQILGFYNDNPLGTNPSAPPSAPVPDDVTMTGYRLSGVDGSFGLFDYANIQTLSLVDGSAVAEDDFVVTYPDRSIHYFNNDGLLERMADRDGNTVSLDWTFNFASSGPSAYTLAAIRAAGDGLGLAGGTAQREIAVSSATVGDFKQWTFTEQLGSTSSASGRRADFYVATVGGTTYGNGDLVKVSPARHNAATCPTPRPSGCTEYDYLNQVSHDVAQVRDPRWDGSTSGQADMRFDLTYTAGTPTAVTDRSRNGVALLSVSSFDTGTSTLYQRALFQDAAQRSSQFATYVDLIPGGSAALVYIPKACSGGQCTTTGSTFPATPTSGEITTRNEFDGLARVATEIRYRVAGASPQLVVSRRATNAGAKVDNYVDALAGGEVAWSQTSDQYLASLRDSGGTNPDLYRSEYTYDAYHQLVARSEPHVNRAATYPAAVSLPPATLPTAYWRLNETAGTSAADSSGNGNTGTIAGGAALNQSGALIGDPAPAITFDGSNDRITSSVALPQAAYTISAWIRVLTDYSGDVNGKGIAGRWLNNSGALLWLYKGRPYLVHGNNYLDGGVQLTLNRWYHVAVSWDGSVIRLYLDGRPIAAKLVTAAPGAGASNFEIASYQNAPGTTFVNATIDEVALYNKALTSVQIADQYVAGRSMATRTLRTAYDSEGHPVEAADHFVVNGGFENGLSEYETSAGATAYVGTIGDPKIKSGFGSLQITGTGTTRQDVQLVPGQTVRWQFAVRTDGGPSTTGTYSLAYWQASTGSWVNLVSASATSATWTTLAYDFTIPFDSDGRVRLSFWNSAGTGTAWFDDALVVSTWAQTVYAANGLVTDAYLLQPGNSSGATLRTNIAHSATATYPALFPTATTVNYVDGVYVDTARDKDLITTRTFDVWGRPLTATDPDGVTQTTSYAANLTDVASVSNGLVTTTLTSDAVGNRLTSTVGGEVTSTTYDLLNRPQVVTAPDGVLSMNSYNDYGLQTARFSNYLDGTPSGAGGTDDLKTAYAYDEYGRPITTVADTGYSGSPDATTTQTYDRLGTVVTSVVYSGPGTAGPRTTTSHFETYTTGGSTYSRGSPSGVQLPIAPAGSPARLCPGSGSVYCNLVATWVRNGSWVSAVDMNGVALAQTDAYGKTTLTDFDLSGHPVRVIANYLAGGGSTADQNVTTTAVYDLAGRRTVTTDPLGRVTATTFDDVDRPIQVMSQTPPGTDYAFTKTVYTAGGRIDRVSAPAAAGTPDANLAWTQTQYDAAGRAIRTLEHLDISGFAHYRIDGFETGSEGWASSSTGWFTTVAAGSSGLDTDFHAVGPANGNGRLRVTTSASANSGAWWDLSGQTYQAGHVYHLHVDVRGPAGSTVEGLFGVDASGASYATTGSVSLTGTWQSLDLNWTPTSSVSANVHVAIRKPSSGAVDLFIDTVQVYETADPGWNIPTETAYDPTGRITASLLPAGHAGEAPMVTTTAYDLASRPVSVTVNATGAFAHQVMADGATNGLVAYYPLDERSGTTAIDVKGGLNATYAGTYRLGAAGGVDENRTAVAFDGSTGAASRSANVSSATNNFSLEAWFRRDAAGTNQVIVHNGTATTGWGVGLDGSGNLAARYETTGWLSTAVSPSVGVWHHVAVVRNAGTTTVFLDGTAYTPSSATAAPSTPGAGFSIGRQAASTRAFAGGVDEVAVYTTALSAGAVSTHWTAGHPSASDSRLTTRSGYDALGRVIEELSPRGIVTRSTVDRLGRTTATTANYRDGSPSGASTDDDVTATAAYNALGELLGTCSPAQVFATGCDPSSGAEDQSWRYGYDAMGHQVSQAPPVNQTAAALSSRIWTYDVGGRLTSVCDFAAGGSCATATRHTDFTYDNLGRELTRTAYAGSGTSTPKLTWTNTWNADGTQATIAFDGTASAEGTDSLTFTYDGLGRPDLVKRSSTVLTDYGWNADGTLATRADGTLGTATFSYDWADRLATMSSPLWSGPLTWGYRLDGLLDTRQWPAGSSGQATLTYDGAKRPTAFAKVGTAAASFAQGYDRDGNVVSEGRALTGVTGDAGTNTQLFGYDGLNRVTGSAGLATTSAYGYDRDGNRISATGATTTTYTYDRTGVLRSRVDAGVTTYYTYDAYGNLTSDANAVNQVTALTYDLADRLLSVVLPGGGNTTTSFTLDGLGRIATRTPPGGAAETYSYLGTSETVWSISATTTVSSALDPGGNRVASKSGTTTGFLLADLHANLAAVVNSGETALLSATRYDPYGMTAALYDSGGAFPTTWKFQGRLDVSTNPADPLYENGARVYLPAVGTFSQLDSYGGSVADPVSLNRYLYAAANPWTLIDPDGHRFESGYDEVHAGSGHPAPVIGPPVAGVQRGLGGGSTSTPSAPPAWDQHVTDFYYNASWDLQDYLVDTHGSEALNRFFASDNGWDDPFLALLAREYIRRHYGVAADQPEVYRILLARWMSHMYDDVSDADRAAAMDRHWDDAGFFAELIVGITGLGVDEVVPHVAGGSWYYGGGGGAKPGMPLSPPLDFSNPSTPPGQGWVWQGKGAPGSTRGNWYNPETGESYHPHLEDSFHEPHYDYQRRGSNLQYRVYSDGSRVLK